MNRSSKTNSDEEQIYCRMYDTSKMVSKEKKWTLKNQNAKRKNKDKNMEHMKVYKLRNKTLEKNKMQVTRSLMCKLK